MTLKTIALFVLAIGVPAIIFWFIIETRRSRSKRSITTAVKKTTVTVDPARSIHDYFDDDYLLNEDTSDSSIEQDSNQRNDNSEQDTDNGPSIYAGIKKHKTLLPKDVAFLYSRLQRLFADEYSVSPRVRMSQVLRPTANTLEDKGLREIFRMLHKTYFDFVLTDLHTCNIRIVLITEQQLDRTKNREFIIGLLCHLNIPVYSYERVANLSDNELVVQISEAIAGANYE